jgi:probable rRNA maturation factor
LIAELTNESDFVFETLDSLLKSLAIQLGLHPQSQISVLITTESRMEELHVEWMGESGATDVLSFPMDEVEPHSFSGNDTEEAPLLGDLVLCPDFAQRQALAAGHSTLAEMELLTVHGVLHLLGYDHAEPEEEKVMFALQAALLDKWRMN